MKRVINILLFVCGISLIGLGTFGIFTNQEKEKKVEEVVYDTIKSANEFNGIYKNNDLTVKLFNYENNKVSMKLTGNLDKEYNEVVNLTLNKNMLDGLTIDSSYHLALKDGVLVVKNDQNEKISLNFTKEGDYTEVEFFKDNNWETSYIEELNGIYKSQEHEIRLFKSQENEITCYIMDNEYSALTKQMTKQGDNTYVIKEGQNPDNIDLIITINENSIDVVSNHVYFKTLTGTYEKTGNYELNNILNDLYL